MTALIRRFPVFSFFVLAYVLTWSISVPLMWTKRSWVSWQLPHEIEGLAAFGPFAAGLICAWAVTGSEGVRSLLRSCVDWRVPLPWLAFTLGGPFVVLVLALLLAPAPEQSSISALLSGFIVSSAFAELIVFGSLAQGIGEEPGWRGFAIPKLRQRFGPLLATIALFPFWLFWHLPAFLGRPEFKFGAFIGFSVGIFSAAVWLTLIYDKTRSALMAILWHVLINLTRGLAAAVSTAAFLMFGQVVAGVALVIVIYWLIKRPGQVAA